VGVGADAVYHIQGINHVVVVAAAVVVAGSGEGGSADIDS